MSDGHLLTNLLNWLRSIFQVTPAIHYSVTVDVHYSSLKMSGVVCVKRGPVVEAEKSLNTQLRMITLSEGSPYETLHDYIASAVAPYFK